MPIRNQRIVWHHTKRNGSVLVLTLILSAVLALAIGAMLLNVRELSRSTSDKIAYEESYHVSLGAVQQVKAWLINPQLAKMQVSDQALALQRITSGSLDLVEKAWSEREINNNPDWSLNQSASTAASYYAANGLSVGNGIENGARIVIWEWNDPAGIMSFPKDANPAVTPVVNLLGHGAGDSRAKITKLRVTTPYCKTGGASSGTTPAGTWVRDNLRQCSLIVEAEAKLYSANGVEKTRWLQQKLIIGGEPRQTTNTVETTGSGETQSSAPPLSPGGAIVSGGAIMVQGSSHMNVWWGPVQVKGDIDILGLTGPQISTLPDGKKAITISAASGNDKYKGAGVTDDVGLEKWLRWQCSGALIDKHGNLLFPAINGVPVTDFFGQLLNGQFGSQYSIDKLTLSGFSVSPDSGLGTYYNAPDKNGVYPTGNGAFVQSSTNVASIVDNTINNDLNYEVWKAYAISKNAYCRPPSSGSQFVNQDGIKLWVKSDRTLIAGSTQPNGAQPFTNLSQVSMSYLVPSNGNTCSIADQVLFVDTKQGTQNGTPTNISLNSSDQFFWKGLLYVNGGVSLSGAGGFQTVFMRSPDDWLAETDPVHNTSHGRLVAGCFLDGILFSTGAISRTGNSSVYGCYVSKTGMSSGGGPYVYYNSRVRGGLFQNPLPDTSSASPNDGKYLDKLAKRMISGPIRELMAWPS